MHASTIVKIVDEKSSVQIHKIVCTWKSTSYGYFTMPWVHRSGFVNGHVVTQLIMVGHMTIWGK